MLEYKNCLRCGTEFLERGDAKKYCSNKCRSADHMKNKREKEKIFLSVEKILKQNHRILESLLNRGEDIPYSDLQHHGFNYNIPPARIKSGDQHVILYYNIGLILNPDKTVKIIDTNELR